jgi:hypothetical protein
MLPERNDGNRKSLQGSADLRRRKSSPIYELLRLSRRYPCFVKFRYTSASFAGEVEIPTIEVLAANKGTMYLRMAERTSEMVTLCDKCTCQPRLHQKRTEDLPHLQFLHRNAVVIRRTPANHLTYERCMRLLTSHRQHPGVLPYPAQGTQEQDSRLQRRC